jgi:hypothetical protein
VNDRKPGHSEEEIVEVIRPSNKRSSPGDLPRHKTLWFLKRRTASSFTDVRGTWEAFREDRRRSKKTGVMGGRTCEIPGKTNQYFRR